MKIRYLIIAILLSVLSCNKGKQSNIDNQSERTSDTNIVTQLDDCCDEEFDKYEDDYYNMEGFIQKLYNNPTEHYRRSLFSADSAINTIINDPDSVKYCLFESFIGDLHFFKAELFYNISDYYNSINELKYEFHFDKNIALACNYSKLKDFDKAKMFLDSIRFPYGFGDYLLGNYYELLGNKDEALSIYKKIIAENQSLKHYVFYQLTFERIKELEKQNPALLSELYFVTRNPGFEVCDTDDETREKIMDTISSIDLIKNDSQCSMTWIYKDPYDNDSNYYWVKVGNGGLLTFTFKTKYDFIIYKEPFEIMFYDPKNNKTYDLDECRKYAK